MLKTTQSFRMDSHSIYKILLSVDEFKTKCDSGREKISFVTTEFLLGFKRLKLIRC